jgi:L-ascorbate metabolism protein UlaG (beta-lactamase superfamily)
MQLIKFGHACVRIEQDDRVLVIDPGTYSEAEALDGVTDVLVTHEHADHIDLEQLATARKRNPALTVHTHDALAQRLDALEIGAAAVAVGQTFTVAGFSVEVVGGEHAEIYEGLPGCPNVGFIVDGKVYHPGDSVFVPATRVETLLVPASAPWLKLREALDFVRAVAPARAFPIHDALFNDLGQANFDRWMDMKGNTDYARIPLGESVTL